MTGRERWLWTVVLFAFAIVELRAINHDRTEHDLDQGRIRHEETEHFQSIANGLSNSIDQAQRNFGATMDRMASIVQTETGGNSFCYVTFLPTRSGVDDLVGLAFHRGRYSLHDLTVRFVELDHVTEIVRPGVPVGVLDYSTNEVFRVGNLSPGTSSAPLKDFKLAGSDKKDMNIFFSATNGVWYEKARLRRVEGIWKQAIKVFRYGNKEGAVMFEKVEPGYPLKDGKVEWGY